MKIYKEVKVATAQEADALPGNTHYFFDNVGRRCYRYGRSWEWDEGEYSYPPFYPATALIAMEAEVEERTVFTDAVSPFTEMFTRNGDDELYDGEGNDITEEYSRWVNTLPTQSRIVTEWK